MNKQWIILYVKPNKEFTVSNILTKKKIENFCPASASKPINTSRDKLTQCPLFPSKVFARINPMEISHVQKLNYVFSIFHVKDSMAFVSEDEMHSLQDFTSRYNDITIKKLPIETNDQIDISTDSFYAVERNTFFGNDSFENISLPSLGIVMMAPLTAQKVGKEKFIFSNTVLKKFQLNIFNF